MTMCALRIKYAVILHYNNDPFKPLLSKTPL